LAASLIAGAVWVLCHLPQFFVEGT
jgi:hypothetical protein